MNRRAFLMGLSTVLAAALPAEAQQTGKVNRPGFPGGSRP